MYFLNDILLSIIRVSKQYIYILQNINIQHYNILALEIECL